VTPRDWQANLRDLAWSCASVPGAVLEFHRSLDGYAPTPLVELPEVARRLGASVHASGGPSCHRPER
jgi:diaminopropionate ammonia-lyase